ncbi:uncharacterized protein [Antedon mediterranea]|uniref:uncharacterized protein n=1 Tax=Antedon mediterranea TaxID=105859 RepID=UPI003AF88BF2
MTKYKYQWDTLHIPNRAEVMEMDASDVVVVNVEEEDEETKKTSLSSASSPRSSQADDATLQDNAVAGNGSQALFHCTQCEFSCNNAHMLNQHLRMHAGDRPHKCHICGFAFSQKGNLTRHIKTHSEEKPYKCHLCPYGARRRDALMAHVQTHSSDKTHICIWCGLAYKQKASLRDHMKKCPSRDQMASPLALQTEPTMAPIFYDETQLDRNNIHIGYRIADHHVMNDDHLTNSDREHSKRKSSTPVRNPDAIKMFKMEDDVHNNEKHPENGTSNEKDTQPDSNSQKGLESALNNVMQMYGHSPESVSPVQKVMSSLTAAYTPTITSIFSQAGQDNHVTSLHHNETDRRYNDREAPPKETNTRTIDLNRTRDFMSRGPISLTQHRSARESHETHSDISDMDNGSLHSEMESSHSLPLHLSALHYDRNRVISRLRNSEKHDKEPHSIILSPSTELTVPQRREIRHESISEDCSRLCTKCNEDLNISTSFKCVHCQIIFLDHVMYTIHMGCHGFREPFECNICGYKCKDRYEFASHLARGKHF